MTLKNDRIKERTEQFVNIKIIFKLGNDIRPASGIYMSQYSAWNINNAVDLPPQTIVHCGVPHHAAYVQFPELKGHALFYY